MREPIYMDNAATTPLREEALEAMVETYADAFGNSSSFHSFGQKAKEALEDSREVFADCIGAEAEEIIFTSGGTESDNLAVKGAARAARERGDHIITCGTEHHAVLYSCEAIEREGFKVTYLPVDEDGIVDLDALREAINDRTTLISVAMANNETGTLQPISEICGIAREHGIIVHSDAVQAAGKMPIDVKSLDVDLLSFSGHKVYGPKGVGALYIRNGIEIRPLMQGGHHERGLRPGTVNVPGIVGMVKAVELTVDEMEDTQTRLGELREMLAGGIMERVKGVHRNGSRELTLPNILNMCFEEVDGESLLLNLDMKGVAVSTGSACTSGATDPSHVLLAIGVPPRLAQGSLRFSFGRYNRKEEVEYVLDILPEIVERIRQITTLGEQPM